MFLATEVKIYRYIYDNHNDTCFAAPALVLMCINYKYHETKFVYIFSYKNRFLGKIIQI